MRDALLPALSGSPVFIEIHDFYESSWRFLNRFVLKRAGGLIVTNRIKIRRLADMYGYPQARMLFQPNAVDAEQFDIPQSQQEARAVLGLPQDKKIALYTGHLFLWKGVRTLADAAALLPEDTRVYFVGGTVEDRLAMEHYVAQKKLPRIVFVPHQPHEKIPLWQRAADVLALPNTAKDEASRVETSPVKLFEYLASGTPIVASDLPSIREIVSEREVVFAEPDDAGSFARAITDTLARPAPERVAAASKLARNSSWGARAAAIDALMCKYI